MKGKIYFAHSGYDYEGMSPVGVIDGLDSAKDIINGYDFVEICVIDDSKYVEHYCYRKREGMKRFWPLEADDARTT